MTDLNWHIVADENIPYVNELFSHFGPVSLRKGRDISEVDLLNADVLLVRSVTRVNEQLLKNCKLQFVGTCTIGIDHLDCGYLDQHKIAWSSAPGCNALGVVQYVTSCLAIQGLIGQDLKIGVVGCGNVGGTLYRYLKALGYRCIGIDPFKTTKDIPDLRPFSEIYDCDVLCLHTPLTHSGPHPTVHLFNKDVLQKLKTGMLLLNAGRGGVIDNQALLEVVQVRSDLKVILDVWEQEPNFNTALLPFVEIATPHIAGYSYEGKINGSIMIFDALLKFLQEKNLVTEQQIQNYIGIREDVYKDAMGEKEKLVGTDLVEIILQAYDVRNDDNALRQAVAGLPESFDLLRKNYPIRREPSHFKVSGLPEHEWHQAEQLGFEKIDTTLCIEV